MSADQNMSMITEDIVRDAMRECYDPEIPVNVVDLGLIYGILMSEEARLALGM